MLPRSSLRRECFPSKRFQVIVLPITKRVPLTISSGPKATTLHTVRTVVAQPNTAC